MTQFDGRHGSTRRCVVSCKNGVYWERMLLCASARDDGVAAVYRIDWGQNWAIYYGHNLSAFGGLPCVTEWIVIHGSGGTDDIGNTQQEELKVIQDLLKRAEYQGKTLTRMTIDEYEVLDQHDRCGARVTVADQDVSDCVVVMSYILAKLISLLVLYVLAKDKMSNFGRVKFIDFKPRH